MKNHGKFTEELYAAFPNTERELLVKIIRMSNMGLAPEGKGSEPKNKLVDLIYGLDDSYFVNVPLPPPTPLARPPIPAKPIVPSAPAHSLGAKSVERLKCLLPALASCVQLAITITIQDFTVLETDRTLTKQKEYVAKGASRTMKSKHLVQPDGFAHAVDLGAWNLGKVTWGFDDYFEIAQAMDKAATQLGIAGHVRWGAVWDRVLSDFGGLNIDQYHEAVEEYKVRHSGSDFLDGPHFEWVP